MSPSLLIVCAAIYGWVALNYGRTGKWGMSIAFVAYAVANLGFALDAWRGR